MARWMSIGGAAAATLLSSTAAFADVTAAGVWEDWESYMGDMGYSVSTGAQDMSGDTLSVPDVTATMEVGDDEGDVTLNLGEVTLRERGDGTVEISLPDTYTVTVIGGDDDKELDLELTFNQSGMTILASGDDAETAYNFVAASMNMQATRFLVDGEAVDGTIEFDLSNYTGNYIMTEGDVTGITGGGRMDSFDVAVKIREPDEDVDIDLAMSGQNLAATAVMALPGEFDPENMAANIANGFSAEGEYTIGSMDMSMVGSGDGESFDIKATTGETEIGFVMNESGLGLNELVSDLNVTISGSEVPLPQVTLKAAEYGLNFLMPVSKSDEPEDFEMGMRLVDLAVQDEIWAMFDPAGILPHDPATLIVETAGKANWFFDIMDPAAEAMMQGGDTPPGELHALTLQELQLTFAGADLTGEGDFTFDNADMTTFPGMPRPEGAIDLQLVGANGLLDKLVQMGLLPEDQAMGARMMMGLFAVQGDGEDTLNSKIEVNDQGHVLANGQRLK